MHLCAPVSPTSSTSLKPNSSPALPPLPPFSPLQQGSTYYCFRPKVPAIACSAQAIKPGDEQRWMTTGVFNGDGDDDDDDDDFGGGGDEAGAVVEWRSIAPVATPTPREINLHIDGHQQQQRHHQQQHQQQQQKQHQKQQQQQRPVPQSTPMTLHIATIGSSSSSSSKLGQSSLKLSPGRKTALAEVCVCV